jgi:hypothetical protein
MSHNREEERGERETLLVDGVFFLGIAGIVSKKAAPAIRGSI